MATDISSSSTESFDATVNAPAGGDPRTSASVRTPMQNIVNRIRFAWARLQEVVGSFLPLSSLYPIALSVSGSTITLSGHGLSANDPVRVWSIGGSVPSPLAQFTTYYVVGGSLTTNTFQVSTTPGGGAVTLTTTGSGAIYGAKLTASTVGQIISNLLTGNNTWSGTNAFSGVLSWQRHNGRPTVKITAAGQIIDTSMGDTFACSAPSVNQTLLLRDAVSGGSPQPSEGEEITISRPSSGAHVIEIMNGGGVNIIADLPSSTRSTVTVRYMDLNDGNGLTWRIVGGFGFTGDTVA
jgi:hypothetical protein